MALKMLAAMAMCALVALVSAQPNPETCRHVTSDPASGTTITFSNLHLIRPTDNSLDFVVSDRSNEAYSYSFRVCENIVQPCGTAGNTPVCQRGFGNNFALGTLDTQFILDFPSLDKSRGILLEYSNGTICPSSGRARRILITIECDPYSTGPLSDITAANHQSQDPCEYELYAKSQYACPQTADNVCAGQKGCAACTLLTGCGWCASTQRCTLGDSTGPKDGSYCLGSKSYYYGSNFECGACSGINSCSECSLNPDCKWCGEDNTCINFFERECDEKSCVCPACKKGQYCPPEGGACKGLANSAGLFVGGMFLGFAIVGIALGGYLFYKRKSADYQGLA